MFLIVATDQLICPWRMPDVYQFDFLNRILSSASLSLPRIFRMPHRHTVCLWWLMCSSASLCYIKEVCLHVYLVLWLMVYRSIFLSIKWSIEYLPVRVMIIWISDLENNGESKAKTYAAPKRVLNTFKNVSLWYRCCFMLTCMTYYRIMRIYPTLKQL